MRIPILILAVIIVSLCYPSAYSQSQSPTAQSGTTQSETSQSGPTYCASSTDGSAIVCGAQATYCESSSKGSAVACGGMATYCKGSDDGSAVACGGMATYCESSSDGSAVACGRMATYCKSSDDGSAVACGEMGSEENSVGGEGLTRGLEALAVFGFLSAIVLGSIWYRLRKRAAQHETLRLLLEKGHDVDQELIDKLMD